MTPQKNVVRKPVRTIQTKVQYIPEYIVIFLTYICTRVHIK